MNKRELLIATVLLLLSFLSFFWFKKPRGYLTFSDSAKFADAARSFGEGRGLVSGHVFFDESILKFHAKEEGWGLSAYPFTSIFLSGIFKLFGQTDSSVVLVGGLFFILTGIGVFGLTKKLFGDLTAYVSLFLFSCNPFILEYSYNATSEIFLMFFLIYGTYFFIEKGYLKALSLVALIFSLATRQQGILVLIVLFGYFLQWVWKKYGKIGLAIACVFGVVSYVVFIKTVCQYDTCPFSWPKLLGPIWQNTEVVPGKFLRGAVNLLPQLTVPGLTSKIVYNFYNFLKVPDKIAPSIVWGFFLIGLFTHLKKEKGRGFGISYFIASLFLLFLLAASATLPNARYVHPILPLVIIFSAMGMVGSVNNKVILFCLVFFVIFPTLGDTFIDYRFRSNIYNYGQPPTSKLISDKVSAEINSRELVITNMDAWMAWYGKLRTMWFPLLPKQLRGYDPKFIVLASYNTEDEDFALGEWKEVLDNPQTLKDLYLRENYQLRSNLNIKAGEVFENKDVKIVILQSKK